MKTDVQEQAPAAQTDVSANAGGQAPQPAIQQPAPGTPPDVETQLENASAEELDAVLETLSGGASATTEEEPAGGDQPSASGEQQSPPTPPATTDDDADPELPKNFRLASEDPAMRRFLLILKREPGVSVPDAWKRAGGTPGEMPTGKPAGEDELAPIVDEQRQQAPAQSANEIQSRIDALKADRKAAREEYDYGKADEISDQINEATIQLARAEQAEVEAGKAERSYQIEHAKAKQAVTDKFAAAGNPNSVLYGELTRENAFLQQTDPGFFDDPQFPMKLVEKVKARRPDLFSGVAPVQPKSQPVQQTLQKPVGEVVPGDAGSQPLNKTSALAAIDNMSPEELDAVLLETSTLSAGRK